jgi:hypothetical protein
MAEKARETNAKNREQNTGKAPKIFRPCNFKPGKPCKSCQTSKTNCSLTPKTDSGVAIRRKIRNRTIVKYVMRATEIAQQELILEKKEGFLRTGRSQAPKSPATQRQSRRAGKQRATSELLPDSPSAPTQQSESPGTNSAVGLLSNMTLEGASSSGDIS